jgi:preprotein translocase subunit SecA
MAEVQVQRRAVRPASGWKRWLDWSTWRAGSPPPAPLALAGEVGELERAYARLSDDDLRERGARYRRAVRVGTPVAELQGEVLALLREVARRELGVRANDSQLAAACSAHAGALVQMAPGEGKSLACAFAVALAALEGRGAHLLCADPYLARRAALRAAPLLEALGLRVSVLGAGPEGDERRKLYAADVVFTTADEVARDALRDFLAPGSEAPVQPRLQAAIVDDADALWLEPLGARWAARDSGSLDAPVLAALPRACVPDLYASWGGMSSVASGLVELLRPLLAREVLELPALRASSRLDHPDVLFTHAAARDRAVVEATARAHLEGRPVLVSAANAAQAAQLGERMRAASVRCSVLEERPGEINAAVLERAGSPGAVTLAVRGVDRGIPLPLGRGVAALGGLCVIATARPGLELADRIVRGVAGQRGAPGATRFFLSLDDASTFGADAAGALSRRWRDVREPGPVSDPTHVRELRHLLALRQRERAESLRSLVASWAVLLQHFQIAVTRRAALGARSDARAKLERAWAEHVRRTDELCREQAERGGGVDGFAAAARESLARFLAALDSESAPDASDGAEVLARLELEIDPAFRA